jgi:Rod binding domain-containing protein
MSLLASTLISGGARILSALDTGKDAPAGSTKAKARASAEDFESVFLQTMIGEMFAGLGKDGPLGEGEAGGAWRSMLVQEYSGNIARAGGIGVADSVYRDILALQEQSNR